MDKYCRCGCGEKIVNKPWHKYRNATYISGHNVRVKNPLSILDKQKDKRKNQTGYLAMKVVSMIRRDAIKSGYEWFLDDVFVYHKMTGDCYYCGKNSDWPKGRNGIDRIDSSVGYYPDNCVSCCKKCNRAKSDMSQKDFYKWIEQVYRHCQSRKRINRKN